MSERQEQLAVAFEGSQPAVDEDSKGSVGLAESQSQGIDCDPSFGETNCISDERVIMWNNVACKLVAPAAEDETREGQPGSQETDENVWFQDRQTEQLEYINYAAIARKRVTIARRRRGSELKRGPACPVCGG